MIEEYETAGGSGGSDMEHRLKPGREEIKHILRCHDFVKDDMVRGENCYLYDRNGKKYVDFESGIWCTMLGHAHPGINRRMIEQISKVTHLGPKYTSRLAEQAAVTLLDTVSDKSGKCVFLSSGSEAVELGVNIAKLVTGKKGMLVLSESYLSAYGSAGTRDDSWMAIDSDVCSRCKETGCNSGCPNLKGIDFDQVAAFVFEPGSSFGKVRFPPKKLIRLLVRETRNSGGLLVVDEVTTGLGRTGKWYGFNHYGLKPEVVTLGKGLGNGYPVSAVFLRQEIAGQLEKSGFRYVQSHQNDPLGCAVASEVVKTIQEDGLVDRSEKLGRKLVRHLQALKDEFASIKEVRGRGLMAAVDFSKSTGRLSAESVANEMLRKGFILGFSPEANLIRFLPPLTIEEGEIDNVIEHLGLVLTTQIQ
jgi:acetylornithine/N-succinyldiaminopimelate aminotransferase